MGSSPIRETSKAVVGEEKSKKDLASAKAALAAFGGGKSERKRPSLQDNLVTVEGYAVPDADSIAYSDPLKKEEKFKQDSPEKKQAPRGVDALFGGAKEEVKAEPEKEKQNFEAVPASHYQAPGAAVPDWFAQAQANAKAKTSTKETSDSPKVKKSRFAEAYDEYAAGQV